MSLAQIFLHVCDGRTLWVPTHQPTQGEVGAVVLLSHVTQQELLRSFYLFDMPIQVHEDARVAASMPNGKSFNDVFAAVGHFRERCTRDETFMMSSRYNPLAVRPAPPVQQQQQYMPQHLMGGAAMPQMYGGMPAAAPYGHHHHHSMMAPPYPSPYGAPQQQAMYHHQHHAYAQHSHHHHHHHHHQQRSMHGAAPANAKFSQVVVDKPQEVDIPIEIPKEVSDLYHQSQGKLFLATMPGARITVWLRSHQPSPANYQRYVHCKGGISLMMKASAADIMDSKPVELFDRQLCTHFLAHNYCSRSGCLHHHHNEAQLRKMIAAKHVLLANTSKRERELMAEEIAAKDREALSRPKEDFETRYAIVSNLPPTVVTGTPPELIRPHNPANPAAPQVSGSVHDSGDADTRRSYGGAEQRPVAPSQLKPRFNGPIGVASDSDSDDSSDGSSSSGSSSSSSGSDSDSAGSGDGTQKKADRAAKKQNKKQLKKFVGIMRRARNEITAEQKKVFKKLMHAEDDERYEIRKKEKRDRKDEESKKRRREEDA